MKKKIMLPLMTAIAMSMICGCSKVAEPIAAQEPETGNGTEATITAHMDDFDNEDGTKTQLEGLSLSWSEGDRIIVISKDDWQESNNYGVYALTGGAGTKDATFKFSSGTEPSDISSNFFCAMYVPDTTMTNVEAIENVGRSLFKYTFPASQTYVKDGVADNQLPMVGYGKSLSDISFQHMCGIVRFQLYSESSVELNKIELSAANPLAGTFYSNYYNYGAVEMNAATTNNSYTLTQTFSEPIELSVDEANPTVFNFVVPIGSKSSLMIVLYDETGDEYAYAYKSAGITIKSGCIHRFPVKKLAFEAIPNAYIKVGDADAVGLYDYNGIPSGNVKITAEEGSVLTSTVMNYIASIVYRGANSSISLDLSSINVIDNQFAGWFVKCTSLKGITLPASITSFASGYLFPKTITEKIVVPDGVAKLDNNNFNNPKCELELGKSVKEVINQNQCTITAFSVNEDNPYFDADDAGALFTKGDTLVFYPGGRAETSYEIPDGTVAIGYRCFYNNKTIEKLTIPASVKNVNRCFAFNSSLTDIYFKGNATDNKQGLTPNDSGNYFNGMYSSTTTPKTIHVAHEEGVGESYYRNHTVWKRFSTILGWAFDDGCTGEIE